MTSEFTKPTLHPWLCEALNTQTMHRSRVPALPTPGIPGTHTHLRAFPHEVKVNCLSPKEESWDVYRERGSGKKLGKKERRRQERLTGKPDSVS